MQKYSTTRERKNTFTLPPVKRSAKGIVSNGIKIMIFSAGFVLFAVFSIAVIAYSWNAFPVPLYKVVALFIEFILFANVAGKYVAWCFARPMSHEA